MAIRNVMGYFYAGLDDGQQPEVAATTEYRDVRADHANLIRKVGADSLVLLKNDNTTGGGLPLQRPHTIAIFGAHAGPSMAGPNSAFSVVGTTSDVYQGHLASAVGSGGLSFSYLATPFQALSLRAAQDGSMFRWIMNDTYSDSSSSSSLGGDGMGGMGNTSGNSTQAQGGPPDSASAGGNNTMSPGAGGAAGGGAAGVMGTGTSVSPSIANYAADSEVCLVFLNSWSGEGGDRSELSNQDQDDLVNSVAESCNNTIVVINTSDLALLISVSRTII
jgi:beta-glucosidase